MGSYFNYRRRSCGTQKKKIKAQTVLTNKNSTGTHVKSRLCKTCLNNVGLDSHNCNGRYIYRRVEYFATILGVSQETTCVYYRSTMSHKVSRESPFLHVCAYLVMTSSTVLFCVYSRCGHLSLSDPFTAP